MSKRTIIAMLIVVFGLGIAGNASGQEKRQKSARKPSVNKPTAARKSSGNRPTTARLQGKNPNSFHIHVNPIQSARRKASAMQQSRVRGGQPIANRTETVDNNETITVVSPKRVQPGNSGGTISNQRTNRNSQDKLGNFEIQDYLGRSEVPEAIRAGDSNGNSARSIRIPQPKGMNKADLTEQLAVWGNAQSSRKANVTPQANRNRTETVGNNEMIRKLPQVQPGNSGGTISNQRTKRNSQDKLGNFEIQGLIREALPLTSGTPRSSNLPQVQPGNSGGTISNQRTQQNSQDKLGNFDIQIFRAWPLTSGTPRSSNLPQVQPGNSGGTISNQRTQPNSQAGLLNFEIQDLWATPRPRTVRPKSIQSPSRN